MMDVFSRDRCQDQPMRLFIQFNLYARVVFDAKQASHLGWDDYPPVGSDMGFHCSPFY
jgi:hypothetical protein